ncbi:hypothetical protein A6R68_16490 [Neotoma lepida]|uniref:Uncharacterized protein n=1 Tax=Neotoma lepida TaxID=56216 RepID=A0A1A6HFQ8_NEOLE|nr:hypothetical protein A6R68_16490 [Neotoma lepida]
MTLNETVGKRIRVKLDGSWRIKVHLDKNVAEHRSPQDRNLFCIHLSCPRSLAVFVSSPYACPAAGKIKARAGK